VKTGDAGKKTQKILDTLRSNLRRKAGEGSAKVTMFKIAKSNPTTSVHIHLKGVETQSVVRKEEATTQHYLKYQIVRQRISKQLHKKKKMTGSEGDKHGFQNEKEASKRKMEYRTRALVTAVIGETSRALSYQDGVR